MISGELLERISIAFTLGARASCPLALRMREIAGESKSDLWERRACAVVVLERLLMALQPWLPAEQQAMVEEVLSLHWEIW